MSQFRPSLSPLEIPSHGRYEDGLSKSRLSTMLTRIQSPCQSPCQSILSRIGLQAPSKKTVRFRDTVQVHMIQPLESSAYEEEASVPSCIPWDYMWDVVKGILTAWEPCLNSEKDAEKDAENEEFVTLNNSWD